MDSLSDNEITLWLQCWKLSSGLPDAPFKDLLIFLSSILPGKAGGFLSTLHLFEKNLSAITPLCETVIYFFCKGCKRSFKDVPSGNECLCGRFLSKNDLTTSGDYFVYCPLKTLFGRFLEIQSNQQAIIKYVADFEPSDDVIRDTMDSARYREISEKDYLQDAENSLIPRLTVQINLDGIEMASTASKSGYPLMLTINELPPLSRKDSILVPFFFMKTASSDFFEMMLNVFTQEMNELSTSGFEWEAIDGSKHITQVLPFCQCMDSMIKYKMYGVSPPSGYNSCPLCQEKGSYLRKGKGGSVSFPVQFGEDGELLCSKPRSNLDIISDGLCPVLSSLPWMGSNYYMTAAIDDLHSIYIGNVKKIIIFIFFSVDVEAKIRNARLEVADEVIAAIRPPNFIERGPRLLSHKTHWRGHEWEEFFFFYSLPIMSRLAEKNLIRMEQRDNWEEYVYGISLINSSKITKDDIALSRVLLENFVTGIERMYGTKVYTPNMHTTTHLTDMVEHLGPLWATSMFKNENFNRRVIKSSNGTRYVPQQTMRNLNMRSPLKILHEEISALNPESIALTHGLFSQQREKKINGAKAAKFANQASLAELHKYRGCEAESEFHFLDSVSFGSIRYATYIHDTNSGFKRQNCYIYSPYHQCFGVIRTIIYDNDIDEAYIVFNEISGSQLVPHGIQKCLKTAKLQVDLLKDCSIAMKVATDNVNYYLFQQLNKFEFLN